MEISISRTLERKMFCNLLKQKNINVSPSTRIDIFRFKLYIKAQCNKIKKFATHFKVKLNDSYEDILENLV